MRPTFMGFETATRGLMVNQKALDIVGNNVSNIGVTGYTRQRVDQVSLSINMRYTRFNQNTVSFAGQGVAAYGVSQIRDPFLDKRFREEYSDVGYYNVTANVLGDIENALDEISPSTMSQAINKFQSVWNDMTLKTVTEEVGAANALAEATQLVQVFRQMSDKLENIWDQQYYNLGLAVDEVNSLMERIAELNDAISQERFNSMDVNNPNYKPLELLDQRNVLLDQLAEFGDITYAEDAEGMVTVKFGGHTVVKGKEFEKLQMDVNDSDERFKTARLFWNDSGEDVNCGSGALRGMLDMLNGRGLNATGSKGENFSQGILYYKDKIDDFARTLADAFNSVIEETDPHTGTPYTPPQYKQMFTFDDPYDRSAANIRITKEWQNDSAYIIKNVKDKIGEDGGKDSNSYAAKTLKLFEATLDFGEYQGTINQYIKFYSNTKLSNDKAYAESRLEAVGAVTDNILNQIQQVSGVSLEEEGVDMMMYKKAYDAVSRVFTALDEMLDKLINGTGVVGR